MTGAGYGMVIYFNIYGFPSAYEKKKNPSTKHIVRTCTSHRHVNKPIVKCGPMTYQPQMHRLNETGLFSDLLQGRKQCKGIPNRQQTPNLGEAV